MESFNGHLCDRGLNDTLFTSLAHTRAALAAWRRDYNTVRPHSHPGGRTPAQNTGHMVRGMPRTMLGFTQPSGIDPRHLEVESQQDEKCVIFGIKVPKSRAILIFCINML